MISAGRRILHGGSRTHDGNEQEIRLNPGTTWVEIVQNDRIDSVLLISKTINRYQRNKNMNANYRKRLKDKKRIVIKIGSSSLIHAETGRLDFRKLRSWPESPADLHNQGKT